MKIKNYYIGGLYALISIVIIYWLSTFLVNTKVIEPFKEVSEYQTDYDFLKYLEDKDIKPKKRSLNFKSDILPQMEGTYQGIDNMENTYWKMDKKGNLNTVYGLYGTISVASPQKIDQGFIYLILTKAGKKYNVAYNGSQLIITINPNNPFVLQLIDDPTETKMELSNINAYIGKIKGQDNKEYTVSKEGLIMNIGTNRAVGQIKYKSTGPPVQSKDGTYEFQFEYIDNDLQQAFGTDTKTARLSSTQLIIYNLKNSVDTTYVKVVAPPVPKVSAPPTTQFGFTEATPAVLQGCKAASLNESSYYDDLCIDRSYYIINFETLQCISVGSDGKTLIMQPIDKNNKNQIWIPRQYRIEDRYNYYDNPWCQMDLKAEKEKRDNEYDNIGAKRAKWMQQEDKYKNSNKPKRNQLLQSKIDYRVNNNNADFLLESANTRSFVKGQYNSKTTLLDLSLLPFKITTKERKGYEFDKPIYENISPTCLYKCDATDAERQTILEDDSYTLAEKKKNCTKSTEDSNPKKGTVYRVSLVKKPTVFYGCNNIIDPPYKCTKYKTTTTCVDKLIPWYYEKPKYIKIPPFSIFGIPQAKIQVGTERTLGGYNKRKECTDRTDCVQSEDLPPYCAEYKCADTRNRQFTGNYQSIICNDKYENYHEMARFRFEGNLLELVTRVEDKYNSLAVKRPQYVEANDTECLITYTDAKTDELRKKRMWFFIPSGEIDRLLPKLKERKRNITLEKQIDTNIKNLDS